LILLRKNGFTDEDYESMDDRQFHNLVGILHDKEEIEKLEGKITLMQIVKLSIVAVMCKGGNEGFKTMYNNTERELKKLTGLYEQEEKVNKDRFKFKGGRHKINRF
jgi:hypothetical protein